MRRVLKPGGRAISITPDWESHYKIFYDDYTHRVPFTVTSLNDIMLVTSFENVQVERWRQLPILWKFLSLNFVSILAAWLFPPILKNNSKFIRFSKEVMLLGVGSKPKE